MDELQMRVFWRRYNELLTGEPGIPETGVYEPITRVEVRR